MPLVRADLDYDDDRRPRPWGSVLGVLRVVGTAIVLMAAIAILVLAFRKPASHP